MPGEYRLVVKGHDGAQIGVLTAYESLTYRKLLNRAGEAVLVANYGASDAADALLGELDYDVILEVQRRVDADSAWYVDWMGLCQDVREEITQAATDKDTWTFEHVNGLLARRLVAPPWDGYYPNTGRVYQANRLLFTAVVGNVMRRLVRDQCVDPRERARRIPGLHVQDDEAETATAGDPGLVFGEDEAERYAVESLATWDWGAGTHLFAGTGSRSAAYCGIYTTPDGDAYTLRRNGNMGDIVQHFTALQPWDENLLYGDRRMYAGTGGSGTGDGEVWRSNIDDPATWTRVGNFAQCTVVHDLELHGSLLYGEEIYAACGYGVYGTYYARGRIYRSFDGAAWEMVYDGNPGGTGTPYGKYICFQGLKSWDGDGYLYAAGLYYGTDGLYHARVIRSQTGDVGSWSVVFDEVATNPDTGADENLAGACCLEAFGGHLYVGLGDRWRPERSGEGRIYRTSDGENWTQVFGSNDDDAPQYAAPGVTCFGLHDGALWLGTGGDARGDARVWFTVDGATWFESFDGRGMEYQTCFCLDSFGGDLYAGFGTAQLSTAGWIQYAFDAGDLWRMTASGWDPPDAQREGSGRWPPLLDVLTRLAESTLDTEGGVDFAVEPYDLGGDTQEFLFSAKAPWGADHRSTSDDPVIFGVPRGNMGEPQYVTDRGEGPTAVYVLARGQEEGRPVLEFRNVAAMAASPWARVEGTVDAQGVSSPVELWELAMEALTNGTLESFGFRPLETASTRYGDWDVGDLITANFRGRVAHCKVEGVEVNLGNNPAVEEIRAEIRLLELA